MEKEVEAVIESIRRNPNWGHADTWKALDALDRSLAKPGDTSTGEMMSDEVLTPEQHRDVVRLIHRETECLHDQGNEFVARHIKFNKKLVDHDTLLDVQAKLLSLTHPKTVDRIREIAREEIARDNAPTAEDAHAFQRTELRWRNVERRLGVLEADSHSPRILTDALAEIMKRVLNLESRLDRQHLRLSHVEDQQDESRLGVGEKGGSAAEVADWEAHRSAIDERYPAPAPSLGVVESGAWSPGEPNLPRPPLGPAPSRAPGNGETAEEDERSFRDFGQRVLYAGSAGVSRTNYFDWKRHVESAARADERKKVFQEVLSILEGPYSWQQGARLYKDRIRALLAGEQEVKSHLDCGGEITTIHPLNEDGSLDEIVGHGDFHLERLDRDVWFLSLGGISLDLVRHGKNVVAQPIDHLDWEAACASKEKR